MKPPWLRPDGRACRGDLGTPRDASLRVSDAWQGPWIEIRAGASKELMAVRDGTPSLGGCFGHHSSIDLHREDGVLFNSSRFLYRFVSSLAGMEYEWTSGGMR